MYTTRGSWHAVGRATEAHAPGDLVAGQRFPIQTRPLENALHGQAEAESSIGSGPIRP